jgi:hypothetical protein
VWTVQDQQGGVRCVDFVPGSWFLGLVLQAAGLSPLLWSDQADQGQPWGCDEV